MRCNWCSFIHSARTASSWSFSQNSTASPHSFCTNETSSWLWLIWTSIQTFTPRQWAATWATSTCTRHHLILCSALLVDFWVIHWLISCSFSRGWLYCDFYFYCHKELALGRSCLKRSDPIRLPGLCGYGAQVCFNKSVGLPDVHVCCSHIE